MITKAYTSRATPDRAGLLLVSRPGPILVSGAAYGVSNSAKVIEGGVQLAGLNLERFDEEADGYILMGVLRFAPADEVLFALHLRAGVVMMSDRLQEMRRLGEAGHQSDLLKYAGRNNNVVAYLASDGRLYLRNKGFWDAMPEDLRTAGRAIPIETVYTATSSREGILGNGARDFVRYLFELAGHRWVPLFPWRPAGRSDVIDAALERSPVIAVSGEGAVERALRHALSLHGFTAVADDPWLVVDPADGMAASIQIAVHAAKDSPDVQVWLVQRVAGESGRRWVEGLHLASRLGIPLTLGSAVPSVILPRNLVVVCAWERDPVPTLPVPVVILAG